MREFCVCRSTVRSMLRTVILMAFAVLAVSADAFAGGLCNSPSDCSNGDLCLTWRCEKPFPNASGICQQSGQKNCEDSNPETIDYCFGGTCFHEAPAFTPTPLPTATPVPSTVGAEIAKIAVSCGETNLPAAYLRYCRNDCTREPGLTDPGFCRSGENVFQCSPVPLDAIQACCRRQGCRNMSCPSAATELGFGGECFTTRVQIAHIQVVPGFEYDIVYCAVYRTSACPTPIPCAGDCNGDDKVVVNELVRAVGIALGQSETTECSPVDRNGDGNVSVDELIAAVGVALNGCVG